MWISFITFSFEILDNLYYSFWLDKLFNFQLQETKGIRSWYTWNLFLVNFLHTTSWMSKYPDQLSSLFIFYSLLQKQCDLETPFGFLQGNTRIQFFDTIFKIIFRLEIELSSGDTSSFPLKSFLASIVWGMRKGKSHWGSSLGKTVVAETIWNLNHAVLSLFSWIYDTKHNPYKSTFYSFKWSRFLLQAIQ